MLSKKSGNIYIAPIGTTIAGIIVILYGLRSVGGFGGLAYSALGFWMIAVALTGGFIVFIAKKGLKLPPQKTYSKSDKVFAFILPVIFLGILFGMNHMDKNYWVLEKSRVDELSDIHTYVQQTQANPEIRGFKRFNISEGKKMIVLTLGEEDKGKQVKVKDVDTGKSTTVLVKIIDKKTDEKNPYIMVGLDEINNPIEVKSTDGEIFRER